MKSTYRMFRQFPATTSRKPKITTTQASQTSPPPENHYDPSIRPWFEKAIRVGQGVSFIGDPYHDYTTNAFMITFARYEKKVGDGPVNVFGIDILLKDLQEEVNSVKFYHSGFAILLAYPKGDKTEDPAVLVYSQREVTEEETLGELNKELLESEYSTLVRTLQEGQFSFIDRMGTKWIGGFGTVMENLVVITVAPETEALDVVQILESDISSTQGTIIGTVVACTIVAILVGFWVVRRTSNAITKPLHDIQTNCDNIQNAQTKETRTFEIKQITVFGHDSLYNLAIHFCTMMKGLNKEAQIQKNAPKYPENKYWDGNYHNQKQSWRLWPLDRVRAEAQRELKQTSPLSKPRIQNPRASAPSSPKQVVYYNM